MVKVVHDWFKNMLLRVKLKSNSQTYLEESFITFFVRITDVLLDIFVYLLVSFK